MLPFRFYRSRQCLYCSFKLRLYLYFYFHVVKVGKKLDLIYFVERKTSCQYSMKYQNIMGKGHIELIEDKEKRS